MWPDPLASLGLAPFLIGPLGDCEHVRHAGHPRIGVPDVPRGYPQYDHIPFPFPYDVQSGSTFVHLITGNCCRRATKLCKIRSFHDQHEIFE